MDATKLDVSKSSLNLYYYCILLIYFLHFKMLQLFEEIDGHVEGEMNVPNNPNTSRIGEPDFNTLDEPIRDTIVSFLCLRNFSNLLIYITASGCQGCGY